MRMSGWRSVLTLVLVVSTVWAEDQPIATPTATNCANGIPGSPACVVTPKARQEAKKAFARGVKLQKNNHLDEALDEFKRAADLVPRDVEYLTLRELVRQQLVFDHLQRGNTALANDQQVLAMGEFRAALNLDPTNDFARQRLNDSTGGPPQQRRQAPRIVEQSNVIRAIPKDDLQTFHFRGDSRQLLTQLATGYGLAATLDESVVSRRVRFDVENVDFYSAMRLAGKITKTMWAPLEAKQIIVAADSTENHRLYDRMGLRSFFVPDIESPQELTDLVNAVRTLFEIKYVSSQPQNSTIVVRAPVNILDVVTYFLENLGSGHPEVMVDVRVFEVSRTLVHAFGLQIPNQFNLYNIPIAAFGLTLAGGQSIQDVINQLIASGGINQANSSAISALLTQLTGSSSSILSQPVATFGNGLTLFGISLGTITATLSRNEGNLRSLEHMTVRASQNKDATVNFGSRYPIINASFAPVFNSSAISSAIGNNSYIAPVPSFTYEDIGLTMKVKPVVHGDSDVSLNVDLKVRALTGAGENGVPIIGNREYTGSINVKNDQSAVVAGEVSTTEQRSLSGIPGIGQFPVLNRAVASNNTEKDEDELIIVVTPHIISTADAPASEIWMTGIK